MKKNSAKYKQQEKLNKLFEKQQTQWEQFQNKFIQTHD